MDSLRVLMTGAGAPGFPSILHCLKNNGERDLYLVGVDMNPMASGRSLADKFYRVPAASDPRFIDSIFDICESEKIDVVISIVTRELELFAECKDRFESINTKLCVMDKGPLHIANNKGLLLTSMRNAGLPTPSFSVVHTPSELYQAIYDLNYPNKPVVVKPTFGNGSRGTRIIDANISRYDLFFKEKPNSMYISLEELQAIVAERDAIPEMMVMEYLPNEEVCVDILADHGEPLYYSCRQGLVISSIMVSQKIKFNQQAIDLCKKVTKLLSLDGVIGFDLKVDEVGSPQIMEINPRLPAGIACSVIAGINFPYLRVKQVLGEILPSCEAREGYMMQIRNEEVLYYPDGTSFKWDK